VIGIIDYGMGNILSVKNALEMIGAEVKICHNPQDVTDVKKLVLPGVGAFRDCIDNLRRKKFVEVLEDQVIKKGKPILGICLGMQVMAKKSYEGGEYNGLGWFDAEVVRLKPNDSSLRIPHVGWNNIEFKKNNYLFRNIPESPDFYFVHSYFMECKVPDDVIATCDYGGIFTASIQKSNIVATQFHPEKSQDFGLTVLQNFLKWTL
jgi:glutamine amidotransferase